MPVCKSRNNVFQESIRIHQNVWAYFANHYPCLGWGILFATVILALGKLRQDEQELQTRLGYIVRACLHKLSAELSTDYLLNAKHMPGKVLRRRQNLWRILGGHEEKEVRGKEARRSSWDSSWGNQDLKLSLYFPHFFFS